MRHTRHLRKINSGIVRGTPRITNGRDLIFHERIIVERQQVSEPRQSITEIKSGAAIAGVISTSHSVCSREQGVLNSAQRDGKIRAAEQASAANPKFKVRRRLEVKLHAIHHRLLA